MVSNINAALVEKSINKGVISGLHGLFSVGGFIGSAVVTTLLGTRLGIVGSAVSAAVFVWLFTFLGCRHLFAAVHDEDKSKKNELNQKNRFMLPHYLVVITGLMCFVMFMTEGSMHDWTGVFLVAERNIDLSDAGYGYSAFAIAMTVCRLTGDRIVERLGRRLVLFLGTLCVFAGYCVAVFIPSVISVFLGFAIIGIGASNIVPQLVSYIATCKEMPVHLSVMWVNAIGYTGILCGPAFIGFLAKVITLEYTFMCLAGLVILVGLGGYYLLSPKKA